MDEKRPKRRKDKYNPYTLSQNEDKHYISFRDGQGVLRELQITKELFEVLNRFELDDLSILNEWDRHIEHFEQTEQSLNRRAFSKEESVEETVLRSIEYERLHRAISELPETQRRRLILYYFEGLTYEQIARMEGCTIMPVKRSIDSAIKKLKLLFK
jgi:RNA polymerase sigma factor (sigma-70 family)